MSAVLAVQKAIRARLVATSAVTALVPAANIRDSNARPDIDPCIVLGDDQMIDEGNSIDRNTARVHSTLHIWKKEADTLGAKAIAGAVWKTIKASRLALDAGFHCGDCRVSDVRFLRDPDGVTTHGVLTVETLVREIA